MSWIEAERMPAAERAPPTSAPRSAARPAPVRRRVMNVGAADDVAEREADRVADAVIARLRDTAPTRSQPADSNGQTPRLAHSAGSSRIRRAAWLPAVRPQFAPEIQRIDRRDESIVRRKIGTGQSHKEVARTEGDVRYIAGLEKEGKYSLQPIGGGPAVDDVDAENEAYTVVGALDASTLAERIKPAENAEAAYDVVAWTSKVRSAIAKDDYLGAKALLERMKSLLGALPKSASPALDDTELLQRLKTLRYGTFLFRDYRAALLLPHKDAVADFKAAVESKKALLEKQVKHDFVTQDVKTLAGDLADKVRAEQRKPDLLPTLIRLIDADKRVVEGSIARQAKVAHEAALPTTMQDVERAEVYKKSAVLKLAQNKARKNVYRAAIELAVTEGVDLLEATTRAALLDHLIGPMEDPPSAKTKVPEIVIPEGLSGVELETKQREAQTKRDEATRLETERVTKETRRIADKIKEATVEAIITRDIAKKSSRMKYLFADSDGDDLLKDVAKLVPADVHKTLLAIKGGEQHSIFEINQYVGDKLNEPLMQWILKKGIEVEVHASGVLASFAQMKSQGFTDVIEIPSSHTGTKKYIVAKPEDGTAKVVFQTLPGESYAIQTVGAFLFYEIYEQGGLVANITVADTTPWKYKDFKARNVISQEKNVARYLLQDKGATLTADVPFTKSPHKIDDDGAIVLDGVPKSAIVVNDVAVKTLDPKKLKVLEEDIDHEKVYLDIMKSNGIDHVDIAALGRKGELKRMLADEGLDPVIELTLPNFNTTVYHVKAGADKKVLAAFQLSPDFFGDRSGALTRALKALGVEHITFVGTSGGLGADVELNDLFVPAELANAAETMPSEAVGKDRVENTAFTKLAELKAAASVDTPALKSGGLHVGVHSPITESMKMIKWLKDTTVQSVDCEAGFIADVLKGSKISLYALYFVGDLPGTHHSIGMGGTAAGEETAEGAATDTGGTKELATSEKLVKAIIKSVVGDTIEQAAREEPDLPPVNKLGLIPILYGLKKEKKNIHITVVEPPVATTGSTIGVLRTFGRSLSKRMSREKPDDEKDKGAWVVTLDQWNAILEDARQFSSTHKVKLLLDVK